MRAHAAALALTAAIAGLGGCSALHRDKPATSKLAAARVAVQNAEAQSDYSGTARTNLDAARYYLQQAEASGKKGDHGKDRENLAYAAEQLATAAMARRESMMLQDKEARDREAQMALHRAETAELEAERARKLAQPPK
jgi:hypothetical protein